MKAASISTQFNIIVKPTLFAPVDGKVLASIMVRQYKGVGCPCPTHTHEIYRCRPWAMALRKAKMSATL